MLPAVVEQQPGNTGTSTSRSTVSALATFQALGCAPSPEATPVSVRVRVPGAPTRLSSSGRHQVRAVAAVTRAATMSPTRARRRSRSSSRPPRGPGARRDPLPGRRRRTRPAPRRCRRPGPRPAVPPARRPDALTRPTRSATSSGESFASKPAASVPSSSEYPKTPTTSRRACPRNDSSATRSSSLSPGNPTMTLERIPAAGARSRIDATRSRKDGPEPNLRIRRSSCPLACWKDRSKYGTTPCADVITATREGRISAGCRYETRTRSIPSTAASSGSRASSSRRSPRSFPYEVEFSLTRNSSRTP